MIVQITMMIVMMMTTSSRDQLDDDKKMITKSSRDQLKITLKIFLHDFDASSLLAAVQAALNKLSTNRVNIIITTTPIISIVIITIKRWTPCSLPPQWRRSPSSGLAVEPLDQVLLPSNLSFVVMNVFLGIFSEFYCNFCLSHLAGAMAMMSTMMMTTMTVMTMVVRSRGGPGPADPALAGG